MEILFYQFKQSKAGVASGTCMIMLDRWCSFANSWMKFAEGKPLVEVTNMISMKMSLTIIVMWLGSKFILE